MNKLAVFAFAALLTLGGLMWFAANNSMAQYLANYLTNINQQLTQTAAFNIDSVRTSASQGLGEATNIVLSTPNSTNNFPSLNIEKLIWQFEKKTLKKKVVEVTNIIIPNVSVKLDNTNKSQAFQEAKLTIEKMIAKAIADKAGLDGSRDFDVTIAKITIDNFYVTIYQDQVPMEEKIASKLVLESETLKQTNSMSVAGAQIVLALLAQIDQELAK